MAEEETEDRLENEYPHSLMRSTNQTSIYRWKGFTDDLGILTYNVFKTVDIVKVSLGTSHCLFKSGDGQVFVCGDNSKGQLGLGTLEVTSKQEPAKLHGLATPVVDIACGDNHCAVVCEGGQAFCWGDSSSGQCGVGSLDLVLLPTSVIQEIQDGFCKEHGLPKPPVIVCFDTISCGAEHTLAVSTDGEVWSWGYGISLGLGEILHALVPRRVDALKGHMAIAVCCGKRHSMAMVLKGDKAKMGPASNSPSKSVINAKDIEVDQHYPSRCKSCKKEIFSYTDTSDMCIIETKHSCDDSSDNTRSGDDLTIGGEDSFHLFSAESDEQTVPDGKDKDVHVQQDSLNILKSKDLKGTSQSISNFTEHGSDQCVESSDMPRSSTSQIQDASSSSQYGQDATSPGTDQDIMVTYSSVPDMALDSSLLYLPMETSFTETHEKEPSPVKCLDTDRDLCVSKVNDNSIRDSQNRCQSDDSGVVKSAMSDDGGIASDDNTCSTSSVNPQNIHFKTERVEGGVLTLKAWDEAKTKDSQNAGSHSIVKSTVGNPVYEQSVSVESDDIIWKRQSETSDDVHQEFKSSQCQGRTSPSATSVKSLNFINQSDAIEYLHRQFEDKDEETPNTQDMNKKQACIQVSDSTPKTERKVSQSGSSNYTSMAFEQVKSMTNRALTNFQSLNVFRSTSGDSPTKEMPAVLKLGEGDLTPDTLKPACGTGLEVGDNSAQALKDDVFSSPESCSMISSVGSLTGEDINDGISKETSGQGEDFKAKANKSGTFIEWRQEMASVSENGSSLNRDSHRGSLRTIEMQKRNLSCSSPGPSSKTEAKPLPHRRVITTTEVYTWGHNKDGQLGVGDTIDRQEPIWLKSLSGRNVMKLAAGDSHSIALTDNNQIYTWGSNSHGQLGQSKGKDPLAMESPYRVKFPKGNTVWDISAGSQHSVFLGDASPGRPDIFYCGKQPKEEKNASLKKAVVPTILNPLRENGWVIRIFAGGSQCACQVLATDAPMVGAFFELAASERSFYNQLIKTSNLLLRPLQKSGKGVTDLTATVQHNDCSTLTHLIRDQQEFIETLRNYSKAFSDFLAVGGFDFCIKTGSEFFADIQGNIQDMPGEKEKPNASSSLFLRAMRYPFLRLIEYSRLITKMASSIQSDCEEKKVYQNSVLDWDGLRLNIQAEHKIASITKTFWDSINTRLADSLRQPPRRVLRESRSHPITLPSAGRFTSQLFVLFNDVFFHSLNNFQVSYPLVTLWVESGNSDTSQQNTLIVTSPEERFEFSCPSATVKAEWLMAFKSAISRVINDEKSLDSLHSSGERFTPPLIRHASHTFVKAGIYKDASYKGTLLSGKVHGLGKMTWPDGSYYTGNFKMGLMHGQGVLTLVKGQSKEVQQGVWKDGRLNGYASIEYANGDMYEGHIKEGLRHGHGMLQTGRLKSNCATVYIGEWVANLRHGYGVEDHILRGEKYMGLWYEDARHGSGVMVTLDGMYFEGNFVNNKLMGFGVMISDDDTLYEGDFVGITYLSGKGTLTLPSGDKLEGSFSGSLNEGLKINGTFLKSTLDKKELDRRQQSSHGSESRYFSRLCVSADSKWTNVFHHSFASLGQGSSGQQRNDSEKAWEAVAVMVSEGLKLLKKEQGANSAKYKIQQSTLEGLEKIPNRDQDSLDSSKVEAISVYLSKAFESSYHPMGQLMNSLVDVFRASYIGVGAHPRLLHHAVEEVRSYVRRIYKVIRILFAVLPATDGPVHVFPPRSSQAKIGVLSDPSFDDEDSDSTIFTAAGLLYPILLPKIYPPLFDLYVLYNEQSDDRYWERVTKLNRQGDVGLMAYLGIEQKFWLIQDILDEGKTQALSVIKDKCYAEPVDQLQQLSTAFSPLEKLKVIEQTFTQITQTVTMSLGDDIMWCMDDLFPIFQFVVVRAKLRHLGGEIHLVEDLMESHLENSEFGIMFTTLKACYFQIQNEKMPHH